eukprot:17650-Heterococcus_DN1.PRE.3
MIGLSTTNCTTPCLVSRSKCASLLTAGKQHSGGGCGTGGNMRVKKEYTTKASYTSRSVRKTTATLGAITETQLQTADSAVATTVATTAIASAAGDSTQLGIMLCMYNSAAAAAAAATAAV